MKRRCLPVILPVILSILLVSGCGPGNEEPDGTSAPAAQRTRAVANPGDVVEAFCEAVINGRYEDAEAYWDEESIGAFSLSTNQLREITSVEETGSGDERHVIAGVVYVQCESGETLEGTIDFTLVQRDGEWKISSKEGVI